MSQGAANWDLEHRLLMPDGSTKHVRAVAHAVRDPSGHLRFFGAVVDKTASKRAEDALNRARAELAHVSRVTTLSALTASIAHEISQPLAGLWAEPNDGPGATFSFSVPYGQAGLGGAAPHAG